MKQANKFDLPARRPADHGTEYSGISKADGTGLSRTGMEVSAAIRWALTDNSDLKTLYAGSVRFNVLLGAIKPTSEVTQEELEAACRDANILEFIQSLPE
jgi:hypothetical protein